MKAEYYAEALYYALAEKPEGDADMLVNNFIRLIEERGHERLFPAIVASFQKLSRRKGQHGAVRLILAHKDDAVVHKEEIDLDLKKMHAVGRPITVEYDQTIIGGYRLESDGERIDASYKSALLNLFQSMVKA